ncbi:MAG: veratrol--corrinoid protein metyltransferase [Lachnospiraceae bacterium]|nr:veratrol--corrinoid protein metyltransferase [Lachnospiraceae bacterium]MBQ1399592.1 veratrol--corrinoid protein metyltransferase [Lachnospiraceae bacterium]MBQ1514763.1 veratrol--corrinoid protein metyltransferase [Lachnospiraceae bacterium]MBQ9464944.1 veratrol--corrinoid protein metyltransferase [Lachnospiraceae bacterium]MBR0106607.1 veratrol--corrinoid protein metyltransferase [Lachnospiraceae bacterium]
MAKLTEKQNYLNMLKGETPEWIPFYDYGMFPGSPRKGCNMMIQAACTAMPMNGGKDIWGVTWVPSESTMNALLPEPDNFILDDITKWRDVIKAPSLDDVDWEMMVKKQIDDMTAAGILDRENQALHLSTHVGYFQMLVAFMGFVEGICAIVDEPEEVTALMEYLSDFYCNIERKMIEYAKPDVFQIIDDTAAQRTPFISRNQYRELIWPYHKRQADIAHEYGIPVAMHCCGNCQVFIDDWIDMGVRAWDPAQPVNDLEGIKAKYGNDLVIIGGWDPTPHIVFDDVTEEELRQSVRDTIDRLAPGGGYCWAVGLMRSVGREENSDRKNKIIFDEVYKYGSTFYQK